MGITILHLQLGSKLHSKATTFAPFQVQMFLQPICTNQFSFLIHLFLALNCLFFSTKNLRPLSPLRCVNVILQFMVFRVLSIKVTKLSSPCSFDNINRDHQ